MSEKITNLSDFTPRGALGQLLTQARTLNHLNEQLSEQLPESLTSLSLCAIDNRIATFVTHNQALAFRMQRQHDVLLNAMKQITSLAHIEKVIIKVNLNP